MWSQGRKASFGRKKTYDVLSIQRENGNGTKNTRKNIHLQINKRKKRKKDMCLSGRRHIEERLNEGPWLQRKHEDGNEAKRTKGNTRERHHDICKPNAQRIQVRAPCGWSTRASESARARLLWAILSLVLPVRFVMLPPIARAMDVQQLLQTT